MPIPSTLDELISDSRGRIERMRRQFGDREDFDFFIRRSLAEMLGELGYDRRTITTTINAMFGE